MAFSLSVQDGAPFEVYQAGRKSRFIIVCEHAANRIPACLGDMGIGQENLQKHFAIDIGAAGVATHLADLLGAPALLARFSRLVVDLNRNITDPTVMTPAEDGVEIVANTAITAEDRAARLDAIYYPFHNQLQAMIEAIVAQGDEPVLLNIHSFTPFQQITKKPRPWHVSVMWAKDQRLSAPFLQTLENKNQWVVGDNEPYSRHEHESFTVDFHAEAKGHLHLMIEVRQDLLTTIEAQQSWAQHLYEALPQNIR